MFVNELIPEDVKGNFPFEVYKDSYGDMPTLWKWTIDHERNIYLVIQRQSGGAYEGTQEVEYLALVINGQVVLVEGVPHLRGTRNSGPEVHWEILDLQLPEGLAESRDLVESILLEALEVKGCFYRKTNKVTVDFVRS